MKNIFYIILLLFFLFSFKHNLIKNSNQIISIKKYYEYYGDENFDIKKLNNYKYEELTQDELKIFKELMNKAKHKYGHAFGIKGEYLAVIEMSNKTKYMLDVDMSGNYFYITGVRGFFYFPNLEDSNKWNEIM